MNREEAFKLFEEMIKLADKELVNFTTSQNFKIEQKVDKTLVTNCDYHIDKILTNYAKSRNLLVVSEEGDKINKIVEGGNYITIDPIDGSLGYIEYVNNAIQNEGIRSFLSKDLGPESDFCLLIGIVENGQPKYGCCFHYVTKEKILLDSENKSKCIIENSVRNYKSKSVIYIDPRPGDEIQKKIMDMDNVSNITQATLGLKSLLTILNNHENAITIHRVQDAGLWDILPTAVATKIFGGILLDDKGNDVVYNKYIILPGKGATCIKGNKFIFVKDELF